MNREPTGKITATLPIVSAPCTDQVLVLTVEAVWLTLWAEAGPASGRADRSVRAMVAKVVERMSFMMNFLFLGEKSFNCHLR